MRQLGIIVIASESKQSSLESRGLFQDRHGGKARLAKTVRSILRTML